MLPSHKTSISLNQIKDSKEEFHLKINFKEEYEINIRLTKSEVNYIIENIKSAIWSERQSIKMGKSANTNVFWTYEAEIDKISILIGQDDETWDIAFLLPFEVIDKMRKEMKF